MSATDFANSTDLDTTPGLADHSTNIDQPSMVYTPLIIGALVVAAQNQ